MKTLASALALALLITSPLSAQQEDRDTKVRNDRQTYGDGGYWIYNDLDAGRARAAEQGKPLLVVFRCIPCEACHEFDEDVASRDPVVRDLMDRFVGVRIVSMNDADLTRFQHDFDQSFAVYLMHPDGTLLGRFGTRSNRDDESVDISLEGLREAMLQALAWHNDYDEVRPSLKGKQVESARFKTPLGYPSLAGRYEKEIDYANAPARSCVHCHQIGEAERRFFRDRAEAIPDQILFPYPNPTVLGLTMDPRHMATVAEVEPGSPAEADGFRAGDQITTLDGQPLLSTADFQWVLHHAPDAGKLTAEIVRDGKARSMSLSLPEGWRSESDLSWRTTSWDLRRMVFGGMLLEPLTEEDRVAAGLSKGQMALRVKHVGQYGDHAVALKAGVKPGDILVAYDGRDAFDSETDILAYGLRARRPGDEVVMTLLRDGKRIPATIKLQ